MKVMKKESILEKDHAQYVWSERECLTSLDHPYIVKLFYSFQVTGNSLTISYRMHFLVQTQALYDSGVSYWRSFVLSALSKGEDRDVGQN